MQGRGRPLPAQMTMKNINKELQKYLKDYWELVLKYNPTFATYIGDHRYNNALEDLSEASVTTRINHIKKLLAKTENIDGPSLAPGDQLNHKLLLNTLNNHIWFYNYKTHYMPLNHLSGPHIDFPQIIEYHPFKSPNDYSSYISRLKAFPGQIDQLMEILQTGINNKMTEFGKTIEHVLGQVKSFTEFTPENHPLMTPAQKMPDAISGQDKNEITGTIKETISSKVTPAYKKLLEYLNKEYVRHCRNSEGIWSLPDGENMYSFFVNYHTTTNLTPGEIHKIGKNEVDRISSDIREVMKRVGFNGSVREFAGHVKNMKELNAESSAELLDGYRKILCKMDEKLPDFFGTLPVAKYDIKEIEKYREQAAPAAYYYPPPKDFSRPGYFYVNTYKPEDRPKYGMEALAYHEAVPGHHLQIAIMQELKNIPDFRRYEGSTAFFEGWALYAELLSKEMGFYQDDYSEYGRLTNEIWRAARLVVDTGIHFFKWDRNKAIQYCMENTGLEEHEINVEIDRYIAMPAQALSYKIGELKILELRDKAMSARGALFDIKEFHDRFLENGALPLHILESIMNNWIEY